MKFNERDHNRIKCSVENNYCLYRLWLLEGRGKKSKALMKCKSGMGLRATPTCCEYSRDGLLVACGCQDGSIQMWDHRKSFVNVALMVRDAHQVCNFSHFVSSTPKVFL